MRLLKFKKKPRYGVFGGYSSWEEALADSAPYETDFNAYHRICDEIKAGAKFGRILMPFLAALGIFDQPVRVLDFGGNLGMTYFALNRVVPSRIASWTIADLPKVKAYGDEHQVGGNLRFITDFTAERPDLVIASHVLQYLERPYETLRTLSGLEPKAILLNEFPLSVCGPQFAVQILPPELGGGRRPAQFLTEAGTDDALSGFRLIGETELPAWAPLIPKTRQVARLYLR